MGCQSIWYNMLLSCKKKKKKTVDLEPTINFTFQNPKITNTWEKLEKLWENKNKPLI